MTYHGSDGWSLVGVADGVSGWSEKGVDAGAYSSVLVHGARQVATQRRHAGEAFTAQDVMAEAQQMAKVRGAGFEEIGFEEGGLRRGVAASRSCNVAALGAR